MPEGADHKPKKPKKLKKKPKKPNMSWAGWQERTRLSILCGFLGLKRSVLSAIILLSDRDEHDFRRLSIMKKRNCKTRLRAPYQHNGYINEITKRLVSSANESNNDMFLVLAYAS